MALGLSLAGPFCCLQMSPTEASAQPRFFFASSLELPSSQKGYVLVTPVFPTGDEFHGRKALTQPVHNVSPKA